VNLLFSRILFTWSSRSAVTDVTFLAPETSPRKRTPLTPPARPVRAIGTYFLDKPGIYLLIYLTFYNRGRLSIVGLNVVFEWSTFLLRIQEVPVSNLGSKTDYPDRVFS
jgi:hypothetical protein